MDGVVTRLSATPAPAAEPTPAAGVVVTPTANGGVTVKRAEEAPTPTEELILGKFKTDEDVRKAYVELEKKLGAKKDETPAAPAAPAASATTDATAAATKAGLDLKALGDEYTAGGNKLSDASMAKLAAAGITAEQVGTYIAGQQAVADKIRADLATVTGGSEKLTATLEWAKANATPEQKAAFDAALDTDNAAVIKAVLTGIHTDYIKAVGQDPKLVVAEPAGGTTGVQPFASQAEVTAAMRDPRYKKGDSAYIKSVEARIKASGGKLWGNRS